MKAPKSKTTSSNLQTQTKQASKPFFGKDGESAFFKEASHDVQTKPFFSSDFENGGGHHPDNKPFFSPSIIQPKLTIGQANDKYEQEADAMADQVVQRMSQAQTVPEVQPKCQDCEQEEKVQKKEVEEETDKDIQEKPAFESEIEPEVQKKEETEELIPDTDTNPVVESSVEPDIQKKVENTPAPPAPAAIVEPAVLAHTTSSDSKVQKKEETEQEEEVKENEIDLQRKHVIDQPIESPNENTVQLKCSACEKEKPFLQQKNTQQSVTAKSDNNSASTDNLESRLSASKGSGSPLSKDTRSDMEAGFGADFSAVRVHTNDAAVQMNRELGAQAFTNGNDIYFNQGKYKPGDTKGDHLLAHELTHTIQQKGAAPDSNIQRYSFDDFIGDVSGMPDAVVDSAMDLGGDIIDTTLEIGEDVVDTTVDAARTAYAYGEAAVNIAVDAASEAVDWISTQAGEAARALVNALGGVISITAEGVIITLPRICPISEALVLEMNLASMSENLMVPLVAFPIPPNLVLSGDVGVAANMDANLQVQLGPLCLNGLRIVINPLTNNYSISGSTSMTTAIGLDAEVRGGLRGQLTATVIVPVGPVLVPIEIPLLGMEGGIAAKARGIIAETVTIGGGLGFNGTSILGDLNLQRDLGLAADLFLGAYAQLDVLGTNICRIYWQPYEWHGDIAASFGIGANFSITPGGNPGIGGNISNPTYTPIPFEQIPLALSREGFSDDCPIIDRVCAVLEALNLLPSQNGGVWNEGGPYGPGARLDGPLNVYERDPGIASGAKCRGACGPDCETCNETPSYVFYDPITATQWEYINFQDCNTNSGCREHDAAYDWAAAEKGETGSLAMILPWHMAANIECACNNLAGNCAAWIFGLPPFDGKLYYADSVVAMSLSPRDQCKEEHPEAMDCTWEGSDRDEVLVLWGMENGFENFRGCRPHRNFPPGVITACEGSSGRTWHCTATDTQTGKNVIISIFECLCCDEHGNSSSEWTEPHISMRVNANLSEEEQLALCDRDLLPPYFCEMLYQRVIDRFGGQDRDPNIDPDRSGPGGVDTDRVRLDDAPVLDSFRRLYNRLDSWDFFIQERHSDFYPEFDTRFEVKLKKQEWIGEIKEKTKTFKREFRDLETQDAERKRREFTDNTLREMEDRISALVIEIAVWYKQKTNSNESIPTIIDRIHREGTELWRNAWRDTILAVNRILSRLWPPAKSRIVGFIVRARRQHPNVDLSGNIADIDYIGSLARGYKSPSKQFIRFNPDKFDVDANIVAPPLAKYAMNIVGVRPDRERIFGRISGIGPLIDFAVTTHNELAQNLEGYDESDDFDVAIQAPELPEQRRHRLATNRFYRIREVITPDKYDEMIADLRRADLVASDEDVDGIIIRRDLTDGQFRQLDQIFDRYEPRNTP